MKVIFKSHHGNLPVSDFSRDVFGDPGADISASALSLVRGGDNSGTDSPDGFVSNDDLRFVRHTAYKKLWKLQHW